MVCAVCDVYMVCVVYVCAVVCCVCVHIQVRGQERMLENIKCMCDRERISECVCDTQKTQYTCVTQNTNVFVGEGAPGLVPPALSLWHTEKSSLLLSVPTWPVDQGWLEGTNWAAHLSAF